MQYWSGVVQKNKLFQVYQKPGYASNALLCVLRVHNVKFYGKRSDIIWDAGAGVHGSDGEKYKQKAFSGVFTVMYVAWGWLVWVFVCKKTFFPCVAWKA